LRLNKMPKRRKVALGRRIAPNDLFDTPRRRLLGWLATWTTWNRVSVKSLPLLLRWWVVCAEPMLEYR
jgi:hypothetical protein